MGAKTKAVAEHAERIGREIAGSDGGAAMVDEAWRSSGLMRNRTARFKRFVVDVLSAGDVADSLVDDDNVQWFASRALKAAGRYLDRPWARGGAK